MSYESGKSGGLTDPFGRTVTYVRVSVTDRSRQLGRRMANGARLVSAEATGCGNPGAQCG